MHFFFRSVSIRKIEKVLRGIRGEKSSKDMASSRNLVSTIEAPASPKMSEFSALASFEYQKVVRGSRYKLGI